jgi:hypothetical protein
MGELTFFLRLQVKQGDEEIFVSQSKYAKDLVKKFGLDNSRHAPTPMSTTIKLTKDEEGEAVDQKVYRGMIGSLLYLTASRPISCLAYIHVLDFKHLLHHLIYLPLNVLSSMLMVHSI